MNRELRESLLEYLVDKSETTEAIIGWLTPNDLRLFNIRHGISLLHELKSTGVSIVNKVNEASGDYHILIQKNIEEVYMENITQQKTLVNSIDKQKKELKRLEAKNRLNQEKMFGTYEVSIDFKTNDLTLIKEGKSFTLNKKEALSFCEYIHNFIGEDLPNPLGFLNGDEEKQ